MSATLAVRRMTEESHAHFTELSGDLNPLHVDREAARSMPPGQRLAYGMDMLLWALESLEAQGALPERLSRMRARFTKWVYLNDVIEIRRASQRSGDIYELVVGETIVAAIDLTAGELKAPKMIAPQNCLDAVRRTEPNTLLLEQFEGHEGFVPVPSDNIAARLFPALAQRFGEAWVSQCATCSYIIGMEAPGLYSMSMKYDIAIHAPGPAARCMHFAVIATDERFRKIRVAVAGSAITATLEAMVREP